MFRLNLWTRPFFPPQPPLGAADGEMENSSFLPNPLTSPALMVLASTAADPSRDNQRMQQGHQFSPQNSDKDHPTPFTSAYPMFRQGDHFPPLYTPMHMPFVQPPVGPISRSGGGAFRPLPQGEDRDYHSAFIPTKRSKHDETFERRTSPESRENGDHHRESPGHKDGPLTPNSITYELSSETFSESGESQDRTTPDAEGRNLRRQRKRTSDGLFPCCPVCGITLRAGEMESHLATEVERLEKISRNNRRVPSRESTPQGRKFVPSPSCSSGMRRGKDSPGLDGVANSRMETYLRVKSNRQSRLSAKTRGGKKKKCQEETICPVCAGKVIGTPEELNEHVEQCLKRMQHGNEDTEVDVDGDMQYEEYTWAGQTRIRATTMLEGGFKGSGFKMANKKEDDDDANLDVDGDDADIYGQPQYSEKDIIPCSMEDPAEQKETLALRGAYLKTEMSSLESASSSPIERTRWSTENNEDAGHTSQESESAKECDDFESSRTEIVESLRIKIKTQSTSSHKGDKHKCLICMEPYTVPLTSIQCWHVHCEECWLRTLGAKKLCPQCNMITSPADLRRIYF